MFCVRCQTPNPETAHFCTECGESFPGKAIPAGTLPPTYAGTSVTSAGVTVAGTSPGLSGSRRTLPAGTLLGNRYEIIEAIGMGGMGMVYRALDRQLNVPVALKMIRDEYAENERMVERFKKEITTARRVTHRNVGRIYDMGETDGLRFISMEYIEGEDLAHILKKEGPMAVPRVVDVLRQVCEALREAHASGVVHRDLKPHNIMLDSDAVAHVMDFGIAMSLDMTGMTRTGTLIGTPEYMSPEQAEGKHVDQRSDIYSLGVTFYEVLTGEVPFSGGTPWETIRKHIEEKARTTRHQREEIPVWIDTLLLKCLEKDPALRYQTVEQILEDIQRQEAHLSARHYMPRRRTMIMAGSAVFLVVAAVGVTMLMRPAVPTAGSGGRLSVAILPFENQSGRQDLEWLRTGLAENLVTDLAESKYFRVLSRERLVQILQELGLSESARMDASALKRIAAYGGVEAVIGGSFLSQGDQIRVNLKVQDPETGEILRTRPLSGRESEVLTMIDQLTLATKEMFDLAPDRMAADQDLRLASARTSSVEAARLFQKGLDMLAQGRNLEAITPLQEAVAADAGFAMAQARLAEALLQIGHGNEAAEAIARATARIDQLGDAAPHADQTFVRALSGRINNQPEVSIAAFQELLKLDSDNPFVVLSLGEAHESTGDYAAAAQQYEKAIALDQDAPMLRFALGRARIRQGDPQAALPELRRALELYTNSGSEEGQGNTLNAIAFANDKLGRADEALGYYNRSEAIKRAIGDKRGLAKTLDNKAGLLQVQGRLAEALRFTEEALALSREIGDADGIARGLVNMGSLSEEMGKVEEMGRYYGEGLEAYKTLKDRAVQITCYYSLARAAAAQGRLIQAKDHLASAEKIARELDDQENLAQVLSEQAQILFVQGQIKDSISRQGEAERIWQAAQREDGVAESRYRLAEARMALGEYGAARELLDAAQRTYTALADNTYLARVRLRRARLLLETGEPEAALKESEAVSGILKTLDNPILLAEEALLRSRSLAARNDPGALQAASETCVAAGRTKAVVPAVQCGVARGLAAPAADAITAALEASTRAFDGGFAVWRAEADLALAQAYARGGGGEKASARAQEALDAARKMGLTRVMVGAGQLVAEGLWAAGQRDAAVKTLEATFKHLDTLEGGYDPQMLRSVRASEPVRSLARTLSGYLKQLGRTEEAATWTARASS